MDFENLSNVPNQEYLLQGSIPDTSVNVLVERLKGLCDDNEPENFSDQEMCFSLKSETPGLHLLLRARRSLDYTEMPWQLRYIGQNELGDKSQSTVIRNSINVGVKGNLLEFLRELGCKLDFDYAVKGFMFRKGMMKITISKINKIVSQEAAGATSEPFTKDHLVELSVLAPRGQNSVAENMKIFAEQLKPLVKLEKYDYRRLPH